MPGPVGGVRVLELGQIIAGRHAAPALADLGAEVVKLEPPGGEGGAGLDSSRRGLGLVIRWLGRCNGDFRFNFGDRGV